VQGINVKSSVLDPWHFEMDRDSDPALFVSAFPDANKKLVRTFTPVFKDNKSLRSHKTVIIKVFLYFLLVDGQIRIRTNNHKSGSGSRRAKNLRIRKNVKSDPRSHESGWEYCSTRRTRGWRSRIWIWICIYNHPDPDPGDQKLSDPDPVDTGCGQ
jgi:hypothetical protein